MNFAAIEAVKENHKLISVNAALVKENTFLVKGLERQRQISITQHKDLNEIARQLPMFEQNVNVLVSTMKSQIDCDRYCRVLAKVVVLASKLVSDGRNDDEIKIGKETLARVLEPVFAKARAILVSDTLILPFESSTVLDIAEQELDEQELSEQKLSEMDSCEQELYEQELSDQELGEMDSGEQIETKDVEGNDVIREMTDSPQSSIVNAVEVDELKVVKMVVEAEGVIADAIRDVQQDLAANAFEAVSKNEVEVVNKNEVEVVSKNEFVVVYKDEVVNKNQVIGDVAKKVAGVVELIDGDAAKDVAKTELQNKAQDSKDESLIQNGITEVAVEGMAASKGREEAAVLVEEKQLLDGESTFKQLIEQSTHKDEREGGVDALKVEEEIRVIDMHAGAIKVAGENKGDDMGVKDEEYTIMATGPVTILDDALVVKVTMDHQADRSVQKTDSTKRGVAVNPGNSAVCKDDADDGRYRATNQVTGSEETINAQSKSHKSKNVPKLKSKKSNKVFRSLRSLFSFVSI